MLAPLIGLCHMVIVKYAIAREVSDGLNRGEETQVVLEFFNFISIKACDSLRPDIGSRL